MALPSFKDFKDKYIGRKAANVFSSEDHYQTYMCMALEELVNRATPGTGGGTGTGGSGGAGGAGGAGGSGLLIDPRNTNWGYHYEAALPKAALVNEPVSIYQSTSIEYGSLLVMSIKMDSPDIRLFVKCYDPSTDYLQLDNTAKELFAMGRIISPTGLGFSLIRYDDTNDIYVIELRPPWPGLPFHKKIDIYVKNEGTTDKNINESSLVLSNVS